MTPAIAAALGGAITIAYVPTLRNQIRDGEVGVPFGTINPIRFRRSEHPVAFHLAAIAMGGFVALLLVACAAILIGSVIR